MGNVLLGGIVALLILLASSSGEKIPPGKINDLEAFIPQNEVTVGDIFIKWTSTGNDGYGPPDEKCRGFNAGIAKWDIRYSTYTIVSRKDWKKAKKLRYQDLGWEFYRRKKAHVIGGLEIGTTYYFALKAKDSSGNVSELSNIASVMPYDGREFPKEEVKFSYSQDYNDYRGQAHSHSDYSDGAFTVERVLGFFQSLNDYDWFMFADHVYPVPELDLMINSIAKYQSYIRDVPGWNNNTFVIAGFEGYVPVNDAHRHFCVEPLREFPYQLNDEKDKYRSTVYHGTGEYPDIITKLFNEYNEDILITIAHPFLKYIHWPNLVDGVIDDDDDKWIKMLSGTDYHLDKETETLDMFDRILAKGHDNFFISYAMVDFHGPSPEEGSFDWRGMKYLSTHIVTKKILSKEMNEETCKELVIDELQQGHSYHSNEEAGDPTGFSFIAKAGAKTVIMGDAITINNNNSVEFNINAPLPGDIKLYHIHNSTPSVVVASSKNTTSLIHKSTLPGAYRVVVSRNNIPYWIFTNPIFIEE